MRLLLAAIVAALTVSSASAAELTVLSPGFVKFAGIDDLAAAYTKETGIKVTVKSTGMGAMMNTIKTGSPAADVVMLPQNLMDQLSADKGVVAGSRQVAAGPGTVIVMIVPGGRAALRYFHHRQARHGPACRPSRRLFQSLEGREERPGHDHPRYLAASGICRHA